MTATGYGSRLRARLTAWYRVNPLLSREPLRKLALYWQPPFAYHRQSKQDPNEWAVQTGPLGRFYFDNTIHLATGHWPDFDQRGLPLRPASDGTGLVHDYTAMSAWAVAHWDSYLLSGQQFHLDRVLAVCDYACATVDRSDANVWRLRAELSTTSGHIGMVSGMDHGQYLSVLARAWQVTRKEEYRLLSERLLDLFRVPVEQDGGFGLIAGNPWYEEETRFPPRFHVLNGMIVALWGLHDFAKVADHPGARELWEAGVESVAQMLPRFDMGWWSWNSLSDSGPHYPASMKYHCLHIVQLRVLADLTGRKLFSDYADRFEGYARSVVCRLRAIKSFGWAKMTGVYSYPLEASRGNQAKRSETTR